MIVEVPTQTRASTDQQIRLKLAQTEDLQEKTMVEDLVQEVNDYQGIDQSIEKRIDQRYQQFNFLVMIYVFFRCNGVLVRLNVLLTLIHLFMR